MEKPLNLFRKSSISWAVMEGDWAGLTATQIAEVLDCDIKQVGAMIREIKRKTGWDVPRIKKR